MSTIYAACLARLGLSHGEAAALHGVRIDTIKSWATGRNRPPAEIFAELRAAEVRVSAIAERMSDDFYQQAPGPLRIDLADRSHEEVMAAAHFVLNMPDADTVEIVDGKTEAAIADRNQRRMSRLAGQVYVSASGSSRQDGPSDEVGDDDAA